MNASEREENRKKLNHIGDDDNEYNSRTLEPNCVQYLIYFDDVSCALEEKKNEIFKHLEQDFEAKEALLSSKMKRKDDVYDAYCYHREGFNLTRAFCDATKRWCLKGTTKFGDALDDEWMVANILFRLSVRFEDTSVRMFDDDGEFLLVECAHVLPMWVEPNVAEGRTFIRRGAVHVVYEPEDEARKEEREEYDEEREDRMDALKTNVDALNALIKASDQKKYMLGDAIDAHLKEHKMKKYYQTEEAIVTSRHLARALLPKRVRKALQRVGMKSMKQKQTFIQLATRVFYERTPADVRSSKDFRNLNFNTPAFAESNAGKEEEEEESSIVIQDDAMMNEMDSVTLRFSRCAYAQLARAKFDAPRKYPMDVIAKTTDADLHNAFDIGMKLVVGMEIALEKLLMSSEDDSLDDEDLAKTFNAEEIAAILQFKDALERVVETKEDEDEEEDAQNLEPESDQWMRDGMRDLDNEILARAAERELHPLSDDDEDGRPSAFDDEFDFDDDLKDDKRREKEKAFSEDVKRVGKKLGTFMNAKATYKGAEEVQRANNINNGSNNSSNNSYSKKEKKKIAPPELDADAFERDLMNALMDDPESEQFLEQFTKDLAFHDNPKDDLRRKVEHDVVQNELDLQAEDFDVAYEAALREQLLGSHVEESVKRTTTTTKTTTIDANDEESVMESETIKDVLKSAVMQNGQSGPATILLGTLRDEEEEA
jgi:hypothetical protein